jgi:hypothetical protein
MAKRRLLACLFLISLVVAVQGQSGESAREQTAFSEADPIQHPVPLPPQVLKLLLQRPEVKGNMVFASDSERAQPAQLFTASATHLGALGGRDFVVTGHGAMTGADNDWFWVVRSAYKNPNVVLFAGGNSLELMKARVNGYRDIKSVWSSPSETGTKIYRFNGVRYKLWQEKWAKNL